MIKPPTNLRAPFVYTHYFHVLRFFCPGRSRVEYDGHATVLCVAGGTRLALVLYVKRAREGLQLPPLRWRNPQPARSIVPGAREPRSPGTHRRRAANPRDEAVRGGARLCRVFERDGQEDGA